MASTDAVPIPRKNVAFRATFPILDADGDLVSGAAGLDSEVSKDAGNFADCTNEATEIQSTGIYYLELTSTEMNADTVAVQVKTSTTGAKTTVLVFYPEEAGDIRVDAVMLSGDSTAADNAESFFDGTGYAGTGNTIPTVTTVNGFGTGAITAAAIAADAIGASELAADAATEIATAVRTALSPDYSRVLDRIDYQRGHHTATGSTFYVDGVGGNDTTGDGTRALPYKTISKALTVCTSNQHDEIILLPNVSGGPTTITETATITITKNYVQIRGPGRDVNVTRSNNGDIFDVQANGVELSGFRVTTFGGGSSNGVVIDNAVDFVRLHRLWIESAHQDAVQINVANRCEIAHCTIVSAVRDGVRVTSGAGSGSYTQVVDNVIRDCGGSGVYLSGSDASYGRIQRNVIRNNGTGVTVVAGAINTVITDNRLSGNTTAITDGGTGTFQAWNFLGTDTSGNISGSVASVTGAVGSVTGNVGGNVVGSVGSVTGAVGSVAGNVGGNVTGSVGSVATGGIAAASFAAGAIDAAAIAADAIGSSELAATAASEIATAVRTELATELARIDAAITTRMASGATVDLAATGLDGVTVESGLNARQALAIMASALAGVLSGAATTTITIKAAGVPGTTRISATVDSDGNRSALTLTPPA